MRNKPGWMRWSWRRFVGIRTPVNGIFSRGYAGRPADAVSQRWPVDRRRSVEQLIMDLIYTINLAQQFASRWTGRLQVGNIATGA